MSLPGKYDEVLTSILVNEKSILGFMSVIFGFLARRTDFYYVPEGKYETMGFPPGVAEELVLKVIRACDPKNISHNVNLPSAVQDEIMCSTVAEEVEVVADEVIDMDARGSDIVCSERIGDEPQANKREVTQDAKPRSHDRGGGEAGVVAEPPVVPVQTNSEAYNGAVTDKYCWSQTIEELDVTVKLPADVKNSKDLKVTVGATDISIVSKATQEVILSDAFTYRIKPAETIWSVSGGKLSIQMEKQQERWWNALMVSETPIDLSKIDCSRPLDELPEDQQAKVRELQWNHERKLRGEPTSEEMKKLEILKKAWDADGSPFKGKPFDPSVLGS